MTEPDWRELYTETKATLLVRDAELHMACESNRVLREREPGTALIAFGVGGIVGVLLTWLVIG
jgi:hypothetical protein